MAGSVLVAGLKLLFHQRDWISARLSHKLNPTDSMCCWVGQGKLGRGKDLRFNTINEEVSSKSSYLNGKGSRDCYFKGAWEGYFKMCQ